MLASLQARSVQQGEAPQDVAAYAAAATATALRDASGRGVELRAEAYYHAVVRRRLLRRCSGTPEAARVVVGSVVADLLSSGRSAQDAWDEVSRGWSHLLTPELSREFRERLCA